MEINEKTKKQILKNLYSIESVIILSAIEDIRNQGDEELLEAMLSILISNIDSEIENKILSCIADLKDNKTIPFLISVIKNNKFLSKKRELLQAFWQTNFNFDEYIDIFTHILITDSFEIAFEAFTIIEIASDTLDDKVKLEQQSIIKKALLSVDSQKKALLEEAITVLN